MKYLWCQKVRIGTLEKEGDDLRLENDKLKEEMRSDKKTASLMTQVDQLKQELEATTNQHVREQKAKESLEGQVTELKRKIHSLEQSVIAGASAAAGASEASGLTPRSENRQRAKEIQELQEKLIIVQRDEREKQRSIDQLQVNLASLNSDLIKYNLELLVWDVGTGLMVCV